MQDALEELESVLVPVFRFGRPQPEARPRGVGPEGYISRDSLFPYRIDLRKRVFRQRAGSDRQDHGPAQPEPGLGDLRAYGTRLRRQSISIPAGSRYYAGRFR